jgi:hypothetical protein
MDKETRAALKKIMLAIGQVQDGEVYLAPPHDEDTAMFDAYEKVATWIGKEELVTG